MTSRNGINVLDMPFDSFDPPATPSAVKHKRSFTMDQFTVTQGTGVNKEFVLTQCNHCNVCISQRKGILGRPGTTNPTRCGEHIDSCVACPEDVRILSTASSGKSAKKPKIGSGSAPAGVNATDIQPSVEAPTPTSPAKPHAPKVSTTTSEINVKVPASEGALDGRVAHSAHAGTVKHKRSFTMDQFTVTQGTGVNRDHVLTRCNHCNVCISQRKGTLGKPGTTNPTRCGEHIEACMACPEDVRILSAASSGKLAKKAFISSASATTGDTAAIHEPSVEAPAGKSPAKLGKPQDSPMASEMDEVIPTIASVHNAHSTNTMITISAVKHKRSFTMDQFTVTQGTGVNRDHVLTQCKHCNVCISQRKGTLGKPGTTNPTRCGEHIEACMACPEDVRILSAASSGKSTKKTKIDTAASASGGHTTNSSTTTGVLDALSTALSSSSNSNASSSSANLKAVNSKEKKKDWI